MRIKVIQITDESKNYSINAIKFVVSDIFLFYFCTFNITKDSIFGPTLPSFSEIVVSKMGSDTFISVINSRQRPFAVIVKANGEKTGIGGISGKCYPGIK